MAKHSTWVRGGDDDLDLSGWVPDPGPTEEELAALRAVLAEQAEQAAETARFWDLHGGDAELDSSGGPDRADAADVDDLADLAQLYGEDAQAAAEVRPGEELAAGLRTAQRGLSLARLTEQGVVSLSGGEVVDSLTAVGAVLAEALTAAFVLAREAADRRLHLDVGMGLVDWLRVRCPHLSPAVVNDLATCARLATAPGADLIAEALAQGRVASHRAARVARTMEQLQQALRNDPDRARAYGQILVDAAARPDLDDRSLATACTSLVHDLIDTAPPGAKESTQEALRRLTSRPLGEGMRRYTIDAPGSDAALMDGLLTGPLAAPVPDSETGDPDPCTPSQRRYDAFRTVLSRGLANPGAPPSTARASVMVTVKADPETGRPAGAAQAQTGQVFRAPEAGRFACLGDLTPIVLGEMGEPLALGRTERLATSGQFKALMVRDQHCTFPGCQVPGTWCEAHHIVWWCRGGTTDIGLLVLLCPRHHIVVHEKGLVATVVGGVSTWHT